MKYITKEEWRKCHKDYKTIRGGGKWMLVNRPMGTTLVPVEIKEDKKTK